MLLSEPVRVSAHGHARQQCTRERVIVVSTRRNTQTRTHTHTHKDTRCVVVMHTRGHHITVAGRMWCDGYHFEMLRQGHATARGNVAAACTMLLYYLYTRRR